VTTLGVHMKKYSPFGVAFAKPLLLRSGATPVHYVARNAKYRGIGPRTVGEWFDQLRKELQNIAHDLGSYVEVHEGRPQFPAKLSPANTPPGHRLIGQLSAMQNDLEFLVFGQLSSSPSVLLRTIRTISIWNGNGASPRDWRSAGTI
jgi:hypothetical protein